MVEEFDSFQYPIIKTNLTFHISTDRFESDLFGKFDGDPNFVVVAGFSILFSMEINFERIVWLRRGSPSKAIHLEDEYAVESWRPHDEGNWGAWTPSLLPANHPILYVK